MGKKRRTANVIFQRPLTKAEESGRIEIAKSSEKGKPIICKKCKIPGGTLQKFSDNPAEGYIHGGCR